ncbi:cupin domain-containing protein [Desulfovibrio piger]|uniref:cupin domain-containing protein n=1 Tax=Desulfovibrio piger TaxID=901 RepID=UPI0026EEFC63|nr:cupin domain-containing protein [Desulfovibrio piger]
MDSLLTLPEDIRLPGIPEHFTPLLASDSGLLVERIVSWGHVTPEGQWYDQEKDEWVLLLEGSARLGFADGREVALERGRCLLLPRHVRHRVLETSKPCIWLAIHAPQLRPQETGGTAGGPQGQGGPRPRFPQRHGQR